MDYNLLFSFKSSLANVEAPAALNNPFAKSIPSIAQLAAKEFQEFILKESPNWEYDFTTRKGKMFGVLVVRKLDGAYAYLGSVSGTAPARVTTNRFVPSVIEESGDVNWLLDGLTEIYYINKDIHTKAEVDIVELKRLRKSKSNALQKVLFEKYNFVNRSGMVKNILEIFNSSPNKNPPSAAGECVGPKLLQYALRHKLQPVALAEFWWGRSEENSMEHGEFYPACLKRCRPILEYMLEDTNLWDQAVIERSK